MSTGRTVTAVALLAAEAGLAGFGVAVHYGLIADYGNITDTTFEAWAGGYGEAGVGGLALVIVTTAALVAAVVANRRWMRLTAVALPALMVLGTLVVTPAALQRKLESQYADSPECGSRWFGGGVGARAARRSEAAFDSIEHVGLFGGGGASGVGGCDRWFRLTEDVDVLDHYRAALPAAGWQVVEDQVDRLRAVRDGMAFEVAVCDDGGVVWAGRVDDHSRARCDLGALG
ncbi:hypothetical protein ACFP3Q_16995 [Nocardioides sp. GCM10027113]|uniref:hypothetical protein n=1 Tax=unclassified Nocardioides TaxID=2615069 RepID=UPI00361FDF38